MSFLELVVHYDQLRSHSTSPLKSLLQHTGNQYQLGTDSTPYLVRLQLRATWPQTYMTFSDVNTVLFGYGSTTASKDDEFLQIALHNSGALFVQRDTACTLPLFYGSDGKTFCLSNNYGTVLRRLKKLTPNQSFLAEALMRGGNARLSTQWQEIKILGENQVLEVDERGQLKLHELPARNWLLTKEAPKSQPKDFSATLQETLEHFIHTKLAGQKYALEASGGLDSSTLPLYLAETGGQSGGILASVIYNDEFEKSQQAKLALLAQRTGYTPLQVPLQVAPECAPHIEAADGTPLYCNIGLYEPAFEALAQRLEQQQVTLIATGEAGDDSFENITSHEHHLNFGPAERVVREAEKLPPFLTSLFREQFVTAVPATPPLPMPRISLSYHAVTVAVNNTRIEHGIWPVTPFADPAYYQFAQGLPAYMRKNKNIMRLFHQAYSWPELIRRPQGNEHFSHFFNRIMTSGMYDAVIEHYAANGQLVQCGLVDGPALLRYYRYCKQKTGDSKHLLTVLIWLRLEVNLAFAD